MGKNMELVQRGTDILLSGLSEFVCEKMNNKYMENWRREILNALGDQPNNLPRQGAYEDFVKSIDFGGCLKLITRRWDDVFRDCLQPKKGARTRVYELMEVRHSDAHRGTKDLSADDAWRAIDTMQRFANDIDLNDIANALEAIKSDVQWQGGDAAPLDGEPARFASGVMTDPVRLPSWREVMKPHPDVAEGRYKTAEFAANLAQAARGEGPIEYSDPKEFFARTYITRGIKDLSIQALRRVSGGDGEPVIQLKTAFGGGKTHSMLALFHLLSGKVPASELAGVDAVLQDAGVTPPARVHTAVLVGTALNPTESRKPPELPDVTVNTLWGEMAAQLAISAGRPELYDLVREADAKSVPPGHEALRQLIDECGPCLILMDEVLAYAKKLYDVKGLPAGSYDNFITFIQELTEAAATSKRGLIAASLPESEKEIGGEAGKRALEAMEHTFSRTSSVWNPVQASEGFEVVRRRLFCDCNDTHKRDEVCASFSRLYNTSRGDFPLFAQEAGYKDKLISCYPIHPEVFDHLYGEWSTLEDFQRTRGVLRLMAAVIHELWMQRDASPMIMPGSIPLNVPDVKNELMRYVPEGWNAIVDKEIDGENSVPYNMDKNSPRFANLMAARRVSRAIMLGSAPTKGKQAVRGIEADRIRLSVVQPDESVSIFNDALHDLKAKLYYLYTGTDGEHYWYGTSPTLRKMAEDRAAAFDEDDAEYFVEQVLHEWKKESITISGRTISGALNICPASSEDVPDHESMTVQIVVLKPKTTFKPGPAKESSTALAECNKILNSHGTQPRTRKNMLIFLVPEDIPVKALKDEMRNLKAWESIKTDTLLNLDKVQEKEIADNIDRCNKNIQRYIKESYCWILLPSTDLEHGANDIYFQEENISREKGAVIDSLCKKLESHAAIATRYAPMLLLDELKKPIRDASGAVKTLWGDGDYIKIDTLWGYLCTYCYLPRLAGYDVFERCIKDGIRSDEYFAYAEGESDGRFIELKIKEANAEVHSYGLLVKREAALRQLEGDKKPAAGSGGQETTGTPGIPYGGGQGNAGEGVNRPPKPAVPPAPANTSFHLSKDLDYVHILSDVRKLMDEVISHLANEGAKLTITLNVEAAIPNGTPPEVARTVKENCNTLGVDDYGFYG